MTTQSTIPRKPVRGPTFGDVLNRDAKRPARTSDDEDSSLRRLLVDARTDTKPTFTGTVTEISAEKPVESSLPWRPFWLRRRVLLVFGIIFMLPIVPIQVLLSISKTRDGIAEPKANLYYLWTFSLTAGMSLPAHSVETNHHCICEPAHVNVFSQFW